MKEELLGVLNTKLDSINNNIESLEMINARLKEEEENLGYVEQILGYFREEDNDYDINKFTSLSKDNFDKCMELVPSSCQDRFNTNSCNYDGLTYLINGINNGIPLTLTEEQEEAIRSLLSCLNDKRLEYLSKIDGITLTKESLEESDLSVLNESKDKYQTIIGEFNNNEYVAEIDDVLVAIDYLKIKDHKKVDMLSFLLHYNADVYNEKGELTYQNPMFEDNEPQEELTVEEEPKEEEVPEEPVTYEVSLPDVNNSELEIMPEAPYEEINVPEPVNEETVPASDLVEENVTIEPPMEYNYETPTDITNLVEENTEVPKEENAIPEVEASQAVPQEVEEATGNIALTDFNNLLAEYRIKLDDEVNSLVLEGNLDSYREILDYLREQDTLGTIGKNQKLLELILTDSSKEIISKVLETIKNDFSIDDEDYVETSKITIDTLPSIFVKEPYGTYENFLKNVELFKTLGFDMINLFDFSRELLVIDNKLLNHNYQLVNGYGVRIDEKNAKYLLAIPNVVEKIDYYVESLYEDSITRKTFDGANIVRMYPSKLDTVTDLTIKRLRYSSENGKKIFGSRENSISGEVANLKVDVLNIPDYYFETFFNNEFSDITSDEVLSYKQMLLDNQNYDFVEDELLQQLKKYQDGIRYNINNVNISCNKVLRNYNILKNNGVDPHKALEFAICYNLVITKDEYMKLIDVLNTLGGK